MGLATACLFRRLAAGLESVYSMGEVNIRIDYDTQIMHTDVYMVLVLK